MLPDTFVLFVEFALFAKPRTFRTADVIMHASEDHSCFSRLIFRLQPKDCISSEWVSGVPVLVRQTTSLLRE